MRQQFAKYIYALMKSDTNLYFLTADLGMYVLDDLKRDFPDRFLNVGAAEQAMLDTAVGLSYARKKVICYSITPFLLYRPFETIRTYINHEELPILLAGSGRDQDYTHDGFSHDASDVKEIMSQFLNIEWCFPESEEQLSTCIRDWYTGNYPAFISLKK